MNILVIGNGFDLAHGLQTTYKDFLRFTDEFTIYKTAKDNRQELGWGDDEDIRFYQYFIDLFNKSQSDDRAKKIVNELDMLIKDNVWLKHFKNVQVKSGWIDFESEISRVVQILEEICKLINDAQKQGKSEIKLEQHHKKVLRYVGVDEGNNLEDAIKLTKERGLKDLDRLIRCLEIYLSDYINNVPLKKTLPDIENLPYLDKVLSFNYTSTFERLYKKHPFIEFDYIHGKADINRNVVTNNMVLGVDEYLKGDERNENIEFIAFKKFYQRIHKETGCLYKNWVAKIKANNKIFEIISIYKENGNNVANKKAVAHHNIFIFGHSLDITDKDVLRDLIINDNVQTVIFYLDKDDYGRKIANLVKVIGQDELIRRIGGTTKTITFSPIMGINSPLRQS
ncbi:MAG: hypothetical protein HDR11_17050 [Lachnospiraceae bacterium]|nr:hypothetical protein [Lachnospiraceae bacterium]